MKLRFSVTIAQTRVMFLAERTPACGSLRSRAGATQAVMLVVQYQPLACAKTGAGLVTVRCGGRLLACGLREVGQVLPFPTVVDG